MLPSVTFSPHEDIYKGTEDKWLIYTFTLLKLLMFITMRFIISKTRIKDDKHRKINHFTG